MMATMRNKPGVVQLKGGDLRHFKVKGRFETIRDSRRCVVTVAVLTVLWSESLVGDFRLGL